MLVKYNEVVHKYLSDRLGIQNAMRIPKLEKVVLNMGLGSVWFCSGLVNSVWIGFDLVEFGFFWFCLSVRLGLVCVSWVWFGLVSVWLARSGLLGCFLVGLVGFGFGLVWFGLGWFGFGLVWLGLVGLVGLVWVGLPLGWFGWVWFGLI